MNKQVNLDALVNEFADQPAKVAKVPTEVEVSFNLEECSRTNNALHNMKDDKKMEFLKSFLDLWYKEGRRAEGSATLRSLLGDKVDLLIGSRLMYTLTGSGRQFRCWYGIPGSMTSEHVDSGGQGCLFGVYGEAKNVAKYVDTLSPKNEPLSLPNGVKVWGISWRYR